MKALIVFLIILLYLMIGMRLFDVAVNALGGKGEYLKAISENHPNAMSTLAYYFAMILTTVFWPYFVLSGLFKRR